MTILIDVLFIIMLGAMGIIYLSLTTKESLWKDHIVEPHKVPERKARIEEGFHPVEKWSVSSIENEFSDVKNQIYHLDESQQKPSRGESLKAFFAYTWYSMKLMWQEKEIFTFALLQWAVIGAGYYLWVQMLAWIPPEVWESAENSSHGSVVDLVLLAWSFVCVGVVAYPLSILSACMGTVHFINRQGRSSSIAEGLRIVLPKVWPLWIFTWTDSWITVNQILERLPKKNDRTTPAQRALSEALYFAWKIGTIGIIPSLITGRGLVESCHQSIQVVRHKFKEVMKLRIAYSALCWVIGVSAYIGTIICFCVFNNLMPHGKEEIYGHVYTFYFWAGVPIFIAVGIVQVFLRPIYVISSCHIYSDYLNEKEEKIMLPTPPSKSASALVAFCALLVILAVVCIYRDQLGITKMLSTKYGETLHW